MAAHGFAKPQLAKTLFSRETAGYLTTAGGFWAAVVYLVCICLYFSWIFPNLTSSLLGPPEDNLQDLWNTWYSQKLLPFNLRGFYFTRSIFYPEGATLIYHSFSYSNLLLIYVIRTLFGFSARIDALVGLNNVMILLSFFLSALGTFYLAKYITSNFFASLIAGFIFAFSPFHIAHSLHHMHVATVQYIPWFVLFFLKYTTEKTALQFCGAVMFFVLGALSSFYYLVYNLFFIGLYCIYSVCVKKRPLIKDLLAPSAAIVICGMVMLSPLLIPMVIKGVTNPRVYIPGHNVYVADLLGFIVFHPYHLLASYAAPINNRLSGNAWEMSVYLGWVNIALLVWSLMTRDAFKIKGYIFSIAVMAVFMLLAMGEKPHVLGKSVDVQMLPTVFLEHLPLLRNLRTPSRAVVYVYLFLGIASGLMIKHLFFGSEGCPPVWRTTHRLRTLILVALSTLIFIDFYPANLASTKIECPPAYSEIVRDPTPTFGILDLPTGYVNGNFYMAYQICHHRPIVNAIISRKLEATLSDRLEERSSARQKDALTSNQVKYIVVHKGLLQTNDFDVAEYKSFYQTIYEDQQSIVFKVY